MNHGEMNHGETNHGEMNHGETKHGGVGRSLWTIISGLLAAGLTITLAASLAGAILATAVDEQLANPDLYVEGLKKNGAFDTMAQALVPAATRARMKARWPDARPEVVAEASAWARNIFTPEWFEARARQVAVAATTFFTGETDEIQVTVPLDDRLRAVVQTLRVRLPVSPLTDVTYERMIEAVASEIARQQRLPFGITVSRETWLEAVALAAPEPWVAENLAHQLDHIVDYLIGDVEHLSIRIPLEQRKTGVAAALRQVIEASNILKFLTNRLVDQHVCGRLQDVELVPEAGITLSRAELRATLDGLLDSEWVAARRTDITRVIAAYLASESETLALNIDLNELKRITTRRISDRITTKVLDYLKTRPGCSAEQTTRLLVGKLDPLTCNPSGPTRNALVLLLEGFIRTEVRKVLDGYVPDRWEYSQANIRAEIGEETWALIARGRRWMKRGITIEEPTLRHLAEIRGVTFLDGVLSVTRAGFTVTEEDLPLHQLGASWPELRHQIDPVRRLIAEIRQAAVPLLGVACGALVMLLLLVSLRTHTRLMWAGTGAIAGGLTVLIGFRIAERLLEPWLRGVVDRAGEQVSPTLAAELTRHAPALLEYVIDRVEQSVDQPAFVLLGVGVAVVLGATAEAVRLRGIPERLRRNRP